MWFKVGHLTPRNRAPTKSVNSTEWYAPWQESRAFSAVGFGERQRMHIQVSLSYMAAVLGGIKAFLYLSYMSAVLAGTKGRSDQLVYGREREGGREREREIAREREGVCMCVCVSV